MHTESLDIILIFNFHFNYLRGREREDRERHHLSVGLLSRCPQGTGSGLKPGMQPGSHGWLQETQYLSCHCCLPVSALSEHRSCDKVTAGNCSSALWCRTQSWPNAQQTLILKSISPWIFLNFIFIWKVEFQKEGETKTENFCLLVHSQMLQWPELGWSEATNEDLAHPPLLAQATSRELAWRWWNSASTLCELLTCLHICL